MPIDCNDTAALAASAACYCYPPKVEGAIIILLLKQLAGNTMTRAELVEAALPYLGMPENIKQAATVFLSCAAANAVGA